MIVNVEIKLSRPSIPTDYRPLLVSLIKAVLSENYPEDYKRLYDSGPVQKTYAFSVMLPHPKFEADKVLLSDTGIKMSLSSWDEKDILLLYNAFQKSKGYQHPMPQGAEMTVSKVSLQPSPETAESTAVIKFLSPLIVRKHGKDNTEQYFVYEDEEFSQCLNSVVSAQLNSPAEIVLEPVSPGKTVVRAFGGNIRASIGTYRITASPQIINQLLRGGIGSRRSEGFGFFTLVGR